MSNRLASSTLVERNRILLSSCVMCSEVTSQTNIIALRYSNELPVLKSAWLPTDAWKFRNDNTPVHRFHMNEEF